MMDVRRRNGLFKSIGYSPHREQQRFHDSDARYRVACCGRRFGKSTMAARDLEPYLLDISQRYMFWSVGPTYDLGEKEFRVVWNDLMIKQGLGKDKRVKRSYQKKQGNMYLEFPWGTRYEVRSADKPDYLVGEALDGVIVAEAAKQSRETWTKYLMPSLSDKRGFATFPTTPEGYNWLYDMHMDGQNPAYPDSASWQFPSWANHVIYPGGRQDPEILRLERTLSSDEFEQEIGANFSSFVGKIYGEFDEKLHCRNIEFNPALPNYIAFDWGFTNPLAAVEFQVDADDNIYVWRVHYKAWMTLHDHLEMMQARPQPPGYHIDLCFGDPANPEKILEVSKDFAPCMGNPECKTDWSEGIMLVKRFLKPRKTGLLDQYGDEILLPKFFVDFSCVDMIREFNNYKSKNAPKGRNAPELPSGIDDHCMDGIRYGLMHLFRLGAAYHLTDVADSNGLDSRALAVVEGDMTEIDSWGAAEEAGVTGFFTTGVQF
jgi:hypothetical protein